MPEPRTTRPKKSASRKSSKTPAEPAPPPPQRQRRSLTQRGGAITVRGDQALSAILSKALTASSQEPLDDLTHGFHTYPARMHPEIASVLVAELSQPGESVLDPFVGSGTVLIEALAQGRRGVGVDLNPLALRIAHVRCQLRDRAARSRFLRTLSAVATASEDSVRSRAVVKVPVERSERAFYDPHVLLELSGLWGEIGHVTEPLDRNALEVVFSSLLVKFSRQRGDTTEELIDKRIRKGLVTEFFERKGQELAQRWEALYESAPRDATAVKLVAGDARRLADLAPKGYSADLVLTSPPYGGTYDYLSHHARRYAWLSLNDEPLRTHEIGARRNMSQVTGALGRWDRELSSALLAMASVLAKHGQVVLWMGDADIGGTRVAADEQVERLAAKVGLRVLAAAAQARPDFRRPEPRREHLLLLGHSR
ncbi:MAG TPA: DNA methyltransferase [Polyangiales bacterium]